MKIQGFKAIRLNDKEFNSQELAFAEEWNKINIRSDYLNTTQLEYLVPDPTERDYQVAATVIQWLGSNVGMSFLQDVINKDKKIKKYLEANT